MADVRLDFYDLDADALPDVCMKCGAPSSVRPIKSFSWMPTWARFMPPIIGVWFVKRRRVPIPLCDQHKSHWKVRMFVALGGLVLLLGLLVGGIVLLASDEDGPGGVLGGVCLAAAGVAFIAWLITVIVLNASQINVSEITDDTILLRNVHYDFTQAYREQTSGEVAPDVERAAREQWGRTAGRRADPDESRRQRGDDYPPEDKYRRG